MTHHARRIPAFPIAAAFFLTLALVSCQRKGIEELVGSELFSLSMGKLEDQIDLFQFEEAMSTKTNSIFMRDGWFYAANGNSGKIMVFSSYGDLIFLLYNPQTNPAPTLLGPADQNAPDTVATRGSVTYPFSDIGRIAVASDRTLYVEDAVADARAVKDNEQGIVRSRIILRFDRKGKVLPALGEEGIGGAPFPYISALHVTASDQLVVVCRLPGRWQVFWFSRDGASLYRVDIADANLPVKPKAGQNPVLIDIVPDLQSPLLYLIIDSYADAADPAAGGAAPADSVVARAYKLDLRTQAYSPNAIVFPQNPEHRTREGLKTVRIPAPPSDFLGVSASGFFYLLAATDTNLYTLQILDRAGRLAAQRRVVIEDSELAFRDLHLDSTGILYGLMADRTRARVALWRSDLMLKGQ
jgi:hypothetical protein